MPCQAMYFILFYFYMVKTSWIERALLMEATGLQMFGLVEKMKQKKQRNNNLNANDSDGKKFNVGKDGR